MPFFFSLFFGFLLAGGLTPLKISNEEVVLQGPLTPFSSRPSTPGKVTVSQIGFCFFFFFPSYQMRWCKKSFIKKNSVTKNAVKFSTTNIIVFVIIKGGFCFYFFHVLIHDSGFVLLL